MLNDSNREDIPPKSSRSVLNPVNIYVCGLGICDVYVGACIFKKCTIWCSWQINRKLDLWCDGKKMRTNINLLCLFNLINRNINYKNNILLTVCFIHLFYIIHLKNPIKNNKNSGTWVPDKYCKNIFFCTHKMKCFSCALVNLQSFFVSWSSSPYFKNNKKQ